jgi:hypothetical protein
MDKKLIIVAIALLVVSFAVVGIVHASGPWFISVTKDGMGHGYVGSLPAGINCGSACVAEFSATTSVVYLGETPASSSYFAGWHGCSEVTSSSVCVVDAPGASSTPSSTVNITATFDLSSSSRR